MSKFVKICPACNASNEATMDFCVSCGKAIKLVVPQMVLETAGESAQKKEARFYKQCRVCGNKNYLANKNVFLDCCTQCGNEDINDVPTQIEEPHEEPKPKVIHHVLKDQSGYEIELNEGGTIGRYGTINSEYFSTNPYVSGNHARIFVSDGVYYIQDLGSTNGTYLNGNKLNPQIKYRLEDNFQITFANLNLVYSHYEN